MLFPDLRRASWGYLNLNLVAREWQRENVDPSGPNLLLNPDYCAEMITAAHVERGLDCSYGGWLEDRCDLWRGSYLDEKGNFTHLGVDFNVPAGTRVASEHHARILRVDTDVPEEGGWGTRIILQPRGVEGLLLYAHLDPATPLRAGDEVAPGDVLACVGRPPDNGGWFPHLHLQRLVSGRLKDLDSLDGYGHKRDLAHWSRTCPDPLPLVSLTR